MIKKFLNFINKPTLTGEILRFIIVGGLATVIDFLVAGIVVYLFKPSAYPNFFTVFFDRGDGIPPIIGSGVGFIFGLIANYLLSIAFVFNKKGESKTIKGFLIFTLFSVIGFFMHLGGMWLFNVKIRIPWFIVKIFMTLIVLVYNYITRKIFIFNKSEKKINDNNTNENLLSSNESINNEDNQNNNFTTNKITEKINGKQ